MPFRPVSLHLDRDGRIRGKGSRNGGATELLAEGSVGNFYKVTATIGTIFKIKGIKSQLDGFSIIIRVQDPGLNLTFK